MTASISLIPAKGSSSDVKQIWLLALTATCVATVVLAVWARIGFGWPERRTWRASALLASIALPVIFVAWLPGGPLGKDWAARAGTPPRDLQRVSATTTVANSGATSTPSTQIVAFAARVSGTVAQQQSASGIVSVDIALAVANPSLGTLHVRIDGTPVAGGGVQMTASSVSIGTSSSPALFSGAVTALEGTQISARVTSADGHTLTLTVALELNTASGTATGTLQVAPVQ